MTLMTDILEFHHTRPAARSVHGSDEMPRVGFGGVALDAVEALLAVEPADGVQKTIDDGDSHSDSTSRHLGHRRPHVLRRLVSTGLD